MRANNANHQEFHKVNRMETHGRSSRSPESESCQGKLLAVIHPWEGKLHRSSGTSQEEL